MQGYQRAAGALDGSPQLPACAQPPLHQPTCIGRLKPDLVLAHRVARAARVALPRRRHGPVGTAQPVQVTAEVAALGNVTCTAGGHGMRAVSWRGRDSEERHRGCSPLHSFDLCIWTGGTAAPHRQLMSLSATLLSLPSNHLPFQGPSPRSHASMNSAMRSAHSGGRPFASMSSGDRLKQGQGGAGQERSPAGAGTQGGLDRPLDASIHLRSTDAGLSLPAGTLRWTSPGAQLT